MQKTKKYKKIFTNSETGIGEGAYKVDISKLVKIVYSTGEIITGTEVNPIDLFELTKDMITVTSKEDEEYCKEDLPLYNGDIKCYFAQFEAPCRLTKPGHFFKIEVYKKDPRMDKTTISFDAKIN